MSAVKHICKKKDYFARGNIKKAYDVKMCDAGTEPEFTSDIEITQLCIVFMTKIKWMTPSPAKYGTQFIPFKTKVITNPKFKYNIRKLIDEHITDNPDWETKEPKIPITDTNNYLEEFSEINNLNRLIDWFDLNNEQFDYINELKKMNELGKLGLAPKLYQIRINNEPPFLPDEIDEKIKDIPDEQVVEISYLVEKCGMNIDKFIGRSGDRNDLIRRNHSQDELMSSLIKHICEFSDTYVERTKGVNCDLKYENLCPIIVDGEIISIRLLDVDPIYSVEENGNPDFVKHAKVFMKFFIFAYLFKKTGVLLLPYWFFNKKNCVFSNVEVREMIDFFYGMDYMIYEFNPINMMYNYLIKTHPLEIKKGLERRKKEEERRKKEEEDDEDDDYDDDEYEEEEDEGPKYEYKFLYFDELKSYFTVEEIISVFHLINLVPSPIDLAKGRKKRKTKKSKKSNKSKKSKKSKKSRKSRK
uniref:Uncharacterized protein n=1 Tax=viral metagenome TaxID=1070528 RepID=A0A6C0I6V4_9ZZZZ